jgi:HK97 family phage major capsid protein
MDTRHAIEQLKRNRRALDDELQALVDKANSEKRRLTDAEERRFNDGESELRALSDRIEELTTQLLNNAAAADASRKYAPTNGDSMTTEKRTTMPGRSGWSVGTEEEVYRPDGGNSYFRDLFRARQHGDRDAADRLAANNARQIARLGGEYRALAGNVAGAGGEWVPPLWMESQFIEFARPGRVTADLTNREPLPPGSDVLNIPKINTGTATAVQASQNTAIQQTDLTTTSVASPVITIAGGQTVSLQLIEQSPLNIDNVILGDLAADYGVKLNTQVLSGSGTAGQAMGILTLSGTTTVAYSPGTPTVATLYSAIANAIQSVHTARFLPPDAIIMHPRRWAYLLAAVDSANRPLVTPKANGPFNATGVQGTVAAQGYVGEIQGLPVYVDSVIPTNLTAGSGTGEDVIIVARMADLWTWESNVRAEAFAETYANQLSVFVRLYNYISFQPARFPQSIAKITGTGLEAPTF